MAKTGDPRTAQEKQAIEAGYWITREGNKWSVGFRGSKLTRAEYTKPEARKKMLELAALRMSFTDGL